MAKTALELTREELRAYRPGKAGGTWNAEKRWTQGWEVARAAGRLLRGQFGATRVVAFGSLARREEFGPWSDIDLAAWGIPTDQFYRAVAAVTGLSPDFEVNLVDAQDCRPSIREAIEREGIEL